MIVIRYLWLVLAAGLWVVAWRVLETHALPASLQPLETGGLLMGLVVLWFLFRPKATRNLKTLVERPLLIWSISSEQCTWRPPYEKECDITRDEEQKQKDVVDII